MHYELCIMNCHHLFIRIALRERCLFRCIDDFFARHRLRLGSDIREIHLRVDCFFESHDIAIVLRRRCDSIAFSCLYFSDRSIVSLIWL